MFILFDLQNILALRIALRRVSLPWLKTGIVWFPVPVTSNNDIIKVGDSSSKVCLMVSTLIYDLTGLLAHTSMTIIQSVGKGRAYSTLSSQLVET